MNERVSNNVQDQYSPVMAGLDPLRVMAGRGPATHVFLWAPQQVVGGPVKPGHDTGRTGLRP